MIAQKTVVVFDIVEVLPTDPGQTAGVAAHLIRDFIAGHFFPRRE